MKVDAATRVAATLTSVLSLALGVWLLTGAAGAQGRPSRETVERLRCLACHAGANRLTAPAKAAQTRGGTISLPDFRDADHGKVPCLECHAKGFDVFPHRGMKTETCMDCHPRKEKGAEDDKPYDFARMLTEYEGTVHFTEFKHAKEKCCGTSRGKPVHPPPAKTEAGADAHRKAAEQRFTCEHCHEPHYFKATKRIKAPHLILANDNRPCLSCHQDGATGALSDPAEPSLLAAHSYLPHAALHLAGTRCVDCHSSVRPAVTHDLPLGRKADQGCNTCHSLDSVLVTRLYRYADLTGTQLGFHNTRVLRDGYVMGANRHRWTDLAVFSAMSLGLTFVLLHAFWRALAWRQRRVDMLRDEAKT